MGQSQALPCTWCTLHAMLVEGSRRWSVPPFKEPRDSQSSPQATPQRAHQDPLSCG